MKHIKSPARRSRNNRLLLGIIVGLLLVGVVVVKIATTPHPVIEANIPMSSEAFPTTAGAQVAWVVRNHKAAMILYHSTTCKSCIIMDALMTKVRKDYEPDVIFIDVITNDISNIEEIRRSGIQFIPTSYFVSATGKNETVVGIIEEQALRDRLDTLRTGD